MATLDRNKLAENTLIMFTSDNGPVIDDGYADGSVENLNGHTPAGAAARRQVQHLRGRHPRAVHRPLARAHQAGRLRRPGRARWICWPPSPR